MSLSRVALLSAATCVLPIIFGASGIVHAQTPTTTVLEQTSACLTSGCVITLTATVIAGQKPVSPGLVYFCNRTDVSCENRVPLGAVPLSPNGTAVLPIQLAVGDHSLRAIFQGTKTYARSQSNALSLTISQGNTTAKPATITTIAATPSPSGYILSSTVSGLQTSPTGTVSFLDASNQNATVATGALGSGTPATVYGAGGDFSQVPAAMLTNVLNLIAGDFNHDGYQDLQILSYGPPPYAPPLYHLLLGNGKGGFTPSPLAPSGDAIASYPGYPSPSYAVAVGDFNNDGMPDYLTFIGSDLYIYLGENGYSRQTPPLTSGAEAVFVGDFKNRGTQDIAVLSGGEVELFAGNGDATFVPRSLGIEGNHLAVGDFDGDGILDIITDGAADITLYHGNGDYTFTQTAKLSVVPSGGQLTGYITGDFNGDGVLDIAATYITDPTDYYYGMNSPSALQLVFYNAQKTTFSLGPAISSPYTNYIQDADLNGDGLPDFTSIINPNLIGGPYPAPPPSLYLTTNVVTAEASTGSAVFLPGATTHNVFASYPGDSIHTASSSSTIPLLGSATDFPTGIGGEAGIALNGAATIRGSSIELTDGKQFEASSFFSANRFFVAGGFSTDFDFQLTNAAADGFAFVLQNTGPDAIGRNGGGLGYGSAPGTTTGGIPSSVALAFDLHNNLGEGNNSIRLEYGGVTSNSLSADLTSSGINLHSGDHFHTSITSDGYVFAVTITDRDTKAVFAKTLPSSGQIPINDYLDGSVAYVGFTGGTGNAAAIQTISNWVFTPGAEPAQLYVSPTYPTGFASAAGLHFNGGAAVSGNAINLTDGNYFGATSVYFTTQAAPTGYPYGESGDPAPIYTDFDFQVVNGIGDGFTFVMQDQGLNAVGSTGGGLGYGPALPGGGGASIANSLAIKFDLHNNAGEGPNSTGAYTYGASPTVPSVDLTPSGVNLSSGHVFHAHLSFHNDGNEAEGVGLVLTDLTKYKVFSTTFGFGYIPTNVYAGFTAGTGATPSSIKILNWTWTEQ